MLSAESLCVRKPPGLPKGCKLTKPTYQSTATGVDGKCMVVFPLKDREAAGAATGDTITVTLELDAGH